MKVRTAGYMIVEVAINPAVQSNIDKTVVRNPLIIRVSIIGNLYANDKNNIKNNIKIIFPNKNS